MHAIKHNQTNTFKFMSRLQQPLISSIHKSLASSQNPLLAFLALKLLGEALDQYPDIKTLKNFHSKLFHLASHQKPSMGIKLMRAYAACGEPGFARKVFDETSERNVVFYNVMIRSYVNNHLYNDALLVFRDMVNGGFRPDNYTYSCVLKACSCSNSLRFGLLLHGAVVKVGLGLNFSAGNGLISMYGKCGCLLEARRVLDEMAWCDRVTYLSFVGDESPYADNGKKGTYFFEFSRPLRTMDHLQQDVQFTIGVPSKMSVAFWYPVDDQPWHGSGHYSVNCDWVPIDISQGSSSSLLSGKSVDSASSSSWNIASAFSLILSVAALCVSVFVSYRVFNPKGVSFTPMEDL